MKEYLVKSIDGNYIYFDYKPLSGMSYIEIPEGAEFATCRDSDGFIEFRKGIMFFDNGWKDGLFYHECTSPKGINLIWQRDSVEEKKDDGKIKLLSNENREFLEKDNVNNPSHYNKGGVECIYAIESSMTKEAFCGYLKGNVIKYMYRYENKGGVESLKKAQWYLNKLINLESV